MDDLFARLGFVEMPGHVTEMRCSVPHLLECTAAAVDVPMPPAPRHRRRRIQKKLVKRWQAMVRVLQAHASILSAIRPPAYRCLACGRMDSFYGAVGRNLIDVQPLPPGAREFFVP